jgi:ribosome-associated protein
MNEHDNDDYLDDDFGPSKSQIKREMHALQDLGKRMLDLSDEQLATLSMDERLRAAIIESRRIGQREARRRHMQYIGKLLRQEEDPDALERAIGAFHAGSEEHTRRHHLAERWRDRMIQDGDSAVSEFVAYCPAAEVQHLRNLVRNARRDAEKQNNTGQSRKLFRALRDWIDDAEQA